MKLPKGVSTFEPVKPRGKNQAFPENNPEMEINRQHLTEIHEENIDENKQQKLKSSRMQIMKQFYSMK